ncbi:MAG: hypothetical protein ACE14L_10140 [Terriglobales bacterium]
MARLIKLVALAAVLSLASQAQVPAPANKSAQRRKPKAAQVKETPPPQPVPIPQMTPEQLPSQPPQVTYRDGQLTVISHNATLGEVLNAIRQQTGAQIETVPAATSERVAARLSGTPREVISGLLDGSRFGYIILGAPGDPSGVERVMLTMNATGPVASPPAANPRAGVAPPAPPQAYVPPDYTPDIEEDSPDVMTDRNPLPPDAQPPQMPNQQPTPGVPQAGQPPTDQASPYVGGEQPRFGGPAQIPPNQQNQPTPDQPQIKTPDQLLQELQRLRQRQQQQPPQ